MKTFQDFSPYNGLHGHQTVQGPNQSINQSDFICIAPYNSQKVHKALSSKSINRQQKKGEEQNKTQK